MKVTIYGSGYVGLVTGACLADVGNKVLCVDVDEEKINKLKQGILPIYELGLYDERTPYFTMKLVKGQTLSAQLSQRKDAGDERMRFITIFGQVCQTLAFAHSKGVIHRECLTNLLKDCDEGSSSGPSQ